MSTLQRVYRRLRRGQFGPRPQDTTAFAPQAAPGPLVTDVFDHIKTIPGWFNIDDCAHFYLLLSLQSHYGVRGDVLEIGSYHGRSTAMLAYCLQPGEKLVVCDAFEMETADPYTDKPSPQQLRANIRRVVPAFDFAALDIHACLSSELRFSADARFRFIHVDGGHNRDVVESDLQLCRKHILPHGIVAVDDYHNAAWPEVTQAADDFLAANEDFAVLADLNRHGAGGRKLYLVARH